MTSVGETFFNYMTYTETLKQRYFLKWLNGFGMNKKHGLRVRGLFCYMTYSEAFKSILIING